MTSLITVNGKTVEHVLTKSDAGYITPRNVVISFARSPFMDAQLDLQYLKAVYKILAVL